MKYVNKIGELVIPPKKMKDGNYIFVLDTPKGRDCVLMDDYTYSTLCKEPVSGKTYLFEGQLNERIINESTRERGFRLFAESFCELSYNW